MEFLSILWVMIYLAFGFGSYYFSLTTKVDKGTFTKLPFATKLLITHGNTFPVLFILLSLLYIGVNLYGFI
jgi:hypothetical protein